VAQRGKRETVKKMTHEDLVTVVMRSAAIEVLQDEADQIDEEVRRLMAEIERTPVEAAAVASRGVSWGC
jgi:intracellular sulfur oxidation DsrE/DsrF family protein